MAKPRTCVHCSKHRVRRARRLCGKCYADPAIRAATPMSPNYTVSASPWGKREPTESELEAVIAVQRANLPAWWDSAAERQD